MSVPVAEMTRESAATSPRPVFIGGCGRSGTTLLGSMLGTHPHCLATPESRFRFLPYRRGDAAGIDPRRAIERIDGHWSFKIWDLGVGRAALLDGCGSYPELVLRIVRAYGRKVGRTDARLWIDHTPGNVKHASLLFEQHPSARLIHMVRDGRATAASVIDLDWGPNTAVAASRWWLDHVARGLAAESLFGAQRVRRVVYEELVSEPARTLRGVCEFLGIDYRPEMVQGTGFEVPRFTAGQHALVGRRPDPGRLHAWRQRLSPREVELFESVAVDLLSGLGYELVYGWQARRAGSWERLGSGLRELLRRRVVNTMRLRRRIRRSVGRRQGPPGGGSGAPR